MPERLNKNLVYSKKSNPSIMIKFQILLFLFFSYSTAFSQRTSTDIPQIITTSQIKISGRGVPVYLGVIRYINNKDTTILDISAFQRNYGYNNIDSLGLQPLIVKFETALLKNNQILELIDKYNFRIIDTKFLYKKIFLKTTTYIGEQANFNELPNYILFTIEQTKLN